MTSAHAKVDSDVLIATLSVLTGGLRPGSGVAAADLAEVRQLVASALARGQVESVPTAGQSASTPDLARIAQVPSADETAQLAALAENAIAEVSDDALHLDDVRIFRRIQPVVTSQLPGSVPAGAAGWAVTRTLGPFLDVTGQRHWFDIRILKRQVQVIGAPGGIVLAVIPHTGALLPSSKYSLPGGTVWVRSKLIAADAPEGAFTGLLIRGGTLTVSVDAANDAGRISVPAAAQFELALDLAPAAVAAGTPRSAPGSDAHACEVTPPTTVTLRGGSAGAGHIVAAADGSLTAYHSTTTVTYAGSAAHYDTESAAILVPYQAQAATFTVGAVTSDLFQPSGTAGISRAFWSLPAATPAGGPTQLGDADGATGLGVDLAAGLSAQWLGLNSRLALNLPAPLAGPCRLTLTTGVLTISATQTDAGTAQSQLALWAERSAPRRSSIEFTFPHPVAVTYVSSTANAEVLILGGVAAVGHLDRPVAADGGRLALQSDSATVTYREYPDDTSVHIAAPIPYPTDTAPPAATTIALHNLFLKTSAPLGFVAAGNVTAGGADLAIDDGRVLVSFARLLAIPMLPDPYASNFDYLFTRGRAITAPMTPTPTPTPDLAAVVSWTQPGTATAQFALLASTGETQAAPPAIGTRTLTATPITRAATVARSADFARGGPDPQTVRGELLDRFADMTSSGDEYFRLFDVSSAADQFGVALAAAVRSDTATGSGPVIEGLDFVAPANTVRILTLPPFQWEPVHNLANPDAGPFPDVVVSDTDGGPARVAGNSVQLVPVAPLSAVTDLVDYYNAVTTGHGARTVTLTTPLPFGMLALAQLSTLRPVSSQPAGLQLNQPSFPTTQATGGLQLEFTAGGPLLSSTPRPRSFAGLTVQTRNVYDPNSPSTMYSVLGDEVDTIFNAEFASTTATQKVPVSRIDLSGYGASLFNDWRDPSADIAATSEVRFEAAVGRTSYEVIQVKSIVYPWGFHVVRTITMQRTGGGGVFRRDSGWVATSEGTYDFTYHKNGALIDPGIVVHPGIIKALRAIRHIRDTSQIYTRTYPPGDPNNTGADPTQPFTVELAAIRFDTDIHVENVQAGANTTGDVPTLDVIGYVQLQPSGVALTPGQLDDLIAAQGAAGGQLNCVFTVGASPLQIRTGLFTADRTQTTAGTPQLAVAARGSALLPQAGQWSFTYRQAAEPEPHVVDPNAAVPLIQQNPVGATTQPYLFADPADLFQPATPAAEYGLLQSSDTQRLLIRAPQIQPGQSAISSVAAFLLADVYALAGGATLFPREDLCIPLPGGCSVAIPAASQLRLAIPPQPGLAANTFTVTTPTERIVTAANSGLTVHVIYADETAAKTTVTWTIDSTTAPDWSFTMGPVSVLGDLGAFTGLMRVVGTISSAAGSAPQLQTPRLLFGGALSAVQDIMNILTAIGIPIALSFALTSSTRKIQSGAILKLPPMKPKPEGGVEEGEIDIGCGKLKGEIKTGFGNAAGDGDTLFTSMENWRLYFELSGDLQVSIIPKLLYVGGMFKLQIEGQANQPTEITLMAGVILSIGGDLITDVLSAEGSVSYCYALQFKGSEIGFGIDIELKISAAVLAGLAEVEISAEAMALATRVDSDTVHVGAQLSLGFEVTLGWVFNESFQVQADYEKDLSMPLFIAAALAAA
jgi:hypothetical protein